MRVIHTVFPILIAFSNSIKASEQTIELPEISYQISSKVEVGIAVGGSYTTFSTLEDSVDKRSQRIYNRDFSQSYETDVNLIRTRVTNPDKKASKPKPSGFLGGLVQAVGGDFSGLLNYGSQFIDHMAEPRYLTGIDNRYTTKENKKQSFSDEIKDTVNDLTKMRQVLTTDLKYDVNAGFLSFTIDITNSGDIPIGVSNPDVLVHFNSPSGRHYVGMTTTTLPETVIVDPGQSYTVPVRIEKLDFMVLFSEYAKSTSIDVKIQNVQVKFNEEFLSPGQLRQQVKGQYVLVDFFDGNASSLQYVKIDPSGETLADFMPKALSSKNVELFDGFISLEHQLPLIKRVNSNVSAESSLSNTTNFEEKMEWRQWFVNVLDDTNTGFNVMAGDKIFPGYTVKVGYFGAKDILPDTVFEPVIYESEPIVISDGSDITIPVELQPGDIIKFTDFTFGVMRGYDITYAVRPLQPLPLGSMISGLPPMDGQSSTPPPLLNYGPLMQNLHVRYSEPNGQPFNKATFVYKSAELVEINPQFLLIDLAERTLPDKETALKYLLNFQLFELRQRFSHYSTPNEIKPHYGIGEFTLSNSQATSSFDWDFINRYISLPGESIEETMNRLVNEEGAFQYQVEKNIPKNQSFWRFDVGSIEIKDIDVEGDFIGRIMGGDTVARLFANGTSVIPIVTNVPEREALGVDLASGFMAQRVELGLIMPLEMIGSANHMIFPQLPGNVIINGSDGRASRELPNVVGAEVKAKVKVLRY